MLSDTELTILSAARDAKFGLFEAVWTLNTERPDLADSKSEAKKAVAALLERGLAELHKAHWEEESERGPFPHEEWEELLARDYCWGRPDDGWYVILKPTAAGTRELEEALRDGSEPVD